MITTKIVIWSQDWHIKISYKYIYITFFYLYRLEFNFFPIEGHSIFLSWAQKVEVKKKLIIVFRGANNRSFLLGSDATAARCPCGPTRGTDLPTPRSGPANNYNENLIVFIISWVQIYLIIYLGHHRFHWKTVF